MKPSWTEFNNSYRYYPEIDLAVDLSHMNLNSQRLEEFMPRWKKASSDMQALERGSIANPDENRMVGHYWLRGANLAPDPAVRKSIESTLSSIESFAEAILNGDRVGSAGAFENLLLIGIGGSALGPQLVERALSRPGQKGLKTWYFDNTDPDGMQLTLDAIGRGNLGRTLAVVISKSGGTKETRNGMLEAENAWNEAGLKFSHHAVAVTSDGSQLYQFAKENSWIDTFPMWDWVGGRTSVMSAVGLLPAALQGFNIREFLRGAAETDQLTRDPDWAANPAAQLATAWYFATNGKGEKAMVILPYKDRLELFSKYLQQLVMESLGKELDLSGKQVHQGITVYGNKGSTDQHAYVQQLRDGVHNFFVTFIEVLRGQDKDGIEVEPGVRTGDYLSGFLQGTRSALSEKNRSSLTLTIPEVTPYSLGSLIALYERAVGFYATLVNINAYHQPGVEAGKKAAGKVIETMLKVEGWLRERPDQMFHVEQIAEGIGAQDDPETVFRAARHLSMNRCGFIATPGRTPAETVFGCRKS